MASKFILLAALVASAYAGGPAAYTISAPSIDGAYVGSSHEHTVKGLYGQNSLSQYSKAVDSAHSSVRVSSSRASNDVLGYAPGYAGHAIAAPAVKYAAPAIAAPAFAHGYAAAPAFGHGYAAAAPAFAHGYAAAPALLRPAAAIKVAAPAIAAPAFGHGYAAPGFGYGYGATYGTHLAGAAIAAPAIKVAAAPALSIAHGGPLYGLGAYGHGAYGHGAFGHAAYGHAAYGPAVYGHGLTPAPLAIKTAVAAAPLVHTSFVGHGAHYAY